MKQRKVGVFVTGIVVLLSLVCVSTAFLANASPYVTVSQARKSGATRLHLAGEIVQSTVVQEFRQGRMTFDLKDPDGQVINVIYTGAPPANLNEAKKVVAVGSMKGDAYYSDELWVKCPSKYEGQAGPTTVGRAR